MSEGKDPKAISSGASVISEEQLLVEASGQLEADEDPEQHITREQTAKDCPNCGAKDSLFYELLAGGDV
jgi:hypothetical protein